MAFKKGDGTTVGSDGNGELTLSPSQKLYVSGNLYYIDSSSANLALDDFVFTSGIFTPTEWDVGAQDPNSSQAFDVPQHTGFTAGFMSDATYAPNSTYPITIFPSFYQNSGIPNPFPSPYGNIPANNYLVGSYVDLNHFEEFGTIRKFPFASETGAYTTYNQVYAGFNPAEPQYGQFSGNPSAPSPASYSPSGQYAGFYGPSTYNPETQQYEFPSTGIFATYLWPRIPQDAKDYRSPFLNTVRYFMYATEGPVQYAEDTNRATQFATNRQYAAGVTDRLNEKAYMVGGIGTYYQYYDADGGVYSATVPNPGPSKSPGSTTAYYYATDMGEYGLYITSTKAAMNIPSSTPVSFIGSKTTDMIGRVHAVGYASDTHGYNVGGMRRENLSFLPTTTFFQSQYDGYNQTSPFPYLYTPYNNQNSSEPDTPSVNLITEPIGNRADYPISTQFDLFNATAESIEKFPFASNFADQTIVGSLNDYVVLHTAVQSQTDGFVVKGRTMQEIFAVGGETNGMSYSATSGMYDTFANNNIMSIEKFPFATSQGDTAAEVGYISEDPLGPTMVHSSAGLSTRGYGYIVGGTETINPGYLTSVRTIKYFPFAIGGGAVATDVDALWTPTTPIVSTGFANNSYSLQHPMRGLTGMSGADKGYVAGGGGTTDAVKAIYYTNLADSESVGDLVDVQQGASGFQV